MTAGLTFEELLERKVSFRSRLLTSPDVLKTLELLGRKEASAAKNTFVYR